MESCLRGSKRNTNNTNTNKSNNTQNRTIKQQQLTREDYYLEQQQQQQQQQQNTKQQYEEQELEDFQLYQLQRRKQKAFLQRQQQQQQQNVNSNENCAQVFATTTLTTKPKFVNNCLQFSAPPPPNYPPPILNATTTTITTTSSIDTPTTIDTTKTTKMANRQQQQQSGLHSQHHLHMQQQQQQTPNNLNLQLQHHVQSTINTLQQQINNLHIEMDTNNRDTRIMNMSHQHQHSHQQQQHPHSHQHQHGIHQQLQHGNGNGNGLMGHGHGHGHHGISALNSSRSPTSTLTSSSSSTSVSMNSGNNMGISPCSRRGHGAMPRYPDPDPDAIEICNEPREINLTRRRDRDRDRERGRDRDREHRERERERQLALEAESMHWPATPHTSSHDYSYAYYEPGVAMRHSNIPAASISPSLSPLGQTPQPPPPPNSMRALLSKGKKNKSLVSAATRHCYQTRYGMRNGECAMQLHPLNTLPHNMLLMHENFYEEISSATEAHAPLRSGVNGTNSHSAGSLNQSLVEEELRRVQSRHRKILGELNLSVEAMLMPESPPPTVGLGCEDDVGANKEKPTVSVTASSGQPNMVSGVRLSASSADNICASSQLSEEMQNNSQLGFCAADLDSGFSGSSGASYIGSLRIHKTNAALSQIKQEKRQVQTTSSGTGTGVSNSLCPFPYATQSCRSFQRGNVTTTRLSQEDDADNDAGFLTRASCGRRILNCAKLRAAEDPGPVGSAASAAMAGNTPPTMSKARSFWNRKGWRKLPGFSTSTSSINDTGLTGTFKRTFRIFK